MIRSIICIMLSGYISISSAVCLGATQSPDDCMQHRFKKGSSFILTFCKNERLESTLDTATALSQQMNCQIYRMHVAEVMEDGSGLFDAVCEAVTFKGEYSSHGKTRYAEYDSRRTGDTSIARLYTQYNAPLGVPLRFIVHPDGRIDSISNIDAMLQRSLGADYATTKHAVRQMLGRKLADELIQEKFQSAFPLLPECDGKRHQTWTIVETKKLGYLAYEDSTRYTWKDATGITARITTRYTGASVLDADEGLVSIDSFEMNGTGSSMLSSLDCVVLRSSRTEKMHAKMSIHPHEELSDGKKTAPPTILTQLGRIEYTVERAQ